MQNKIIVIGAGIAGLSCVEALFHHYNETNSHIKELTLLSDTGLVKKITNYTCAGRLLESFDVEECTIDEFNPSIPEGLKYNFILGSVVHVDCENKIVLYKNNNNTTENIHYDKLCICLGSKPRELDFMKSCKQTIRDKVVVIRDTDTVKDLERKLKDCDNLVIIGNGGISLELVSKIQYCDKTWIVRDDFIGSNYFDSGAAKFLKESAISSNSKSKVQQLNHIIYSELKEETKTKTIYGPSLGPNWSHNLNLIGNNQSLDNKFNIIYNDEVVDIIENNDNNNKYCFKVITKNGNEIFCDLVASAIGVEPNSIKVINSSLELSSTDGGILIDNEMRSSLNDIYAAGDVVSCEKWTNSELWFQKRLWTQARQMGYYAGRCISCHILGSNPTIYFNFDCFTHCTTFFGFKLVLLGNYNAQFLDLDKKHELIARVNPNKDYVKLIINNNGRIIGAVLVGESGLEETIENLMHDKIDVSRFKEQLLDDTVDIDDYFD